MLCSRYTHSSDVVFGVIASGRQAEIDHVDRIAGPNIAALPVRVALAPSDLAVGSFLDAIQTQAVEMIPWEQTGLGRISRVSEHARRACSFQSMLVVQPRPITTAGDAGCWAEESQTNPSLESYHRFNSHALMAVCTIGEDRFQVDFSFDASVMDSNTVGFLAEHFGKLVRELCKAGRLARLSDINMLSNCDLDHIWEWNDHIEDQQELCVHEIIGRVARTQPHALAITAWDGELTYGLLDHASLLSVFFRLVFFKETRLLPFALRSPCGILSPTWVC